MNEVILPNPNSNGLTPVNLVHTSPNEITAWVLSAVQPRHFHVVDDRIAETKATISAKATTEICAGMRHVLKEEAPELPTGITCKIVEAEVVLTREVGGALYLHGDSQIVTMHDLILARDQLRNTLGARFRIILSMRADGLFDNNQPADAVDERTAKAADIFNDSVSRASLITLSISDEPAQAIRYLIPAIKKVSAVGRSRETINVYGRVVGVDSTSRHATFQVDSDLTNLDLKTIKIRFDDPSVRLQLLGLQITESVAELQISPLVFFEPGDQNETLKYRFLSVISVQKLADIAGENIFLNMKITYDSYPGTTARTAHQLSLTDLTEANTAIAR